GSASARSSPGPCRSCGTRPGPTPSGTISADPTGGHQPGTQPAIPARLVGAHNARNWTASIVIGIELKSVQNGGLGLGLPPGGDLGARGPDRLSARCRG